MSLRRAETYDETYYIRGRTGDIWVWHWGYFSFYIIGLVLLVYCGSSLIFTPPRMKWHR